MTTLPDWLIPVARHVEGNQLEGHLPGATDAQIEQGRAEAKRLGLHIDDQAMTFYRFMNGTAAAGIAIAGLGIDEQSDRFSRQDFASLNSYHADWRGAKTLYGYVGDVFFVYDPDDGQFKQWDAEYALEQYGTFAEMIAAVFSQHNAVYEH